MQTRTTINVAVKAFISYSFKDEEIMDNLRKKLQSNGVKCYVSRHDENYGGSLPEKLTSAIDDNDVVLVILTKNGSESSTVNQEIGYAKNKKRIISLLEFGVSPPIFLQGIEHAGFTHENMDGVFSKISKFVATMPLEMRKSTGKSLREIVAQEGIDLETDRRFVRFVLEQGRKYLITKYGKLDVPLSKEIKILFAIGIGFLIPVLSVIGWNLLFSHEFDPNVLYLEIGLALLGAPAGVVFYIIQIIEKRKCKKCSSNFGKEMTDSKLVDRKELSRTQNYVRTQEIHRNTYTCKFCGDVVIKNEPEIYTEYLGSSYL